jgi:hypothetical protein
MDGGLPLLLLLLLLVGSSVEAVGLPDLVPAAEEPGVGRLEDVPPFWLLCCARRTCRQ